MTRTVMLLLAASLILTANGAAQRQPPADRLWIEFGVGAGTFHPLCSGCVSSTTAGPVGELGLGYDLAARWTGGITVSGWTAHTGAVRDRQAFVLVTAEFAPRAFPLRVSGGLGLARYTETATRIDGTTDRIAATGPGLALGLSYPIPLRNGWDLAMQVSGFRALAAGLTSSSGPLNIRTSSTVLRIGVGIRWHWIQEAP